MRETPLEVTEDGVEVYSVRPDMWRTRNPEPRWPLERLLERKLADGTTLNLTYIHSRSRPSARILCGENADGTAWTGPMGEGTYPVYDQVVNPLRDWLFDLAEELRSKDTEIAQLRKELLEARTPMDHAGS